MIFRLALLVVARVDAYARDTAVKENVAAFGESEGALVHVGIRALLLAYGGHTAVHKEEGNARDGKPYEHRGQNENKDIVPAAARACFRGYADGKKEREG